MNVPRPHRRRPGRGGHDDQRDGAEEQLPGGQRKQIDLVPLPQQLGDDGARRPAQGASDGEERARSTLHLPGGQDEDQPGERQTDRDPLEPFEPLPQRDPGHQQQPERHGVGEDGGLAGAFALESPGHQAEEAGGLKHPQQRRHADGFGPHRPPEHRQEEDQDDAGGEGTHGGIGKGLRVGEHDLHHRPGVAPDEGEEHERAGRESVGVPARGGGLRGRGLRAGG